MNKEITLAFDNSSSTMYWWKEAFNETVIEFQKLGFDVVTLNSDEMGLADKSKPLILFSDCMSHKFGQILKQLEIHSAGALVCLINPVFIGVSALNYALKSRIFPNGSGNEYNNSFTIWDWDKKDVPNGLVLPYVTGTGLNCIAYLMGADPFDLVYLTKNNVWVDCLVFDKHDVFIKKYNEDHAQRSYTKDNTAEYLVASFYARYRREHGMFDLHELVESLANQKLKDFDVETIMKYVKPCVHDNNPRILPYLISHFLLGSGLVYISKFDLSNPANTRYSFYEGVVDNILSSNSGFNTRKSILRFVLSLQGYNEWDYDKIGFSEECYYLARILDDGINDAQQLLDTNNHLCDKDFALVVSKSPLSKALFSARKNDTDIRIEWLKLEFVIAKKLLFVLVRENPVKYKKYLTLVH